MSSYKSVHDLIMLTHHIMLLTSLLIVAWSCNIAAVLGFSASSRLSHNKLHLITFDLDDTIFPIGPVVADANEAQLARLNAFGYTNANNDEIIKASKAIRTELREAGNVLSYTDLRKQSIKREIVRVTPNLQTHQVDESVVDDVFDSWLSMRHESADKNLYDDCVDALEAIRQQHPDAVIGAITNGRGNPLYMPSVQHYFDFCVSGEDEHVFPKRKPDRGIYEAALDTFFNMRGDSIIPEDNNLNWIHVGDDLANDVGASAVCGAKAIWLCTEDDELEADLPSWSTATTEELERRAKLNDSAKEYVSAKISNLTELEKAVLDILTS